MTTVTIRVRTFAAFIGGIALMLVAATVMTTAWRADAAPGADESTFVSVTPCRLADTRAAPNRVGPAGTMSDDATQSFTAIGDAGECTSVPPNATAVSLNVTALGASELTFLTFWPDGDRPLAASLNPAPGQPPVPNAVTVGLSGAGGFNVYNASGSVDIVMDVTGYFVSSGLQDLTTQLNVLAVDLDDVTARLGAAETSAAARLQRIEALEAQVASLQTDVIDVDEAQPFAVESETVSASPTVTSTTSVVSVAITAPVAGSVTAVSNALINTTGTAGLGTTCSLNDDEAVDSSYEQGWGYGGASNYEQIAGTRRFPVDAGTKLTIHLVCRSFDAGTKIFDPVITAIFTPTP